MQCHCHNINGPQIKISQATKDVKEGACVSSLYLSITTFADLEMISLNYVNQSFANEGLRPAKVNKLGAKKEWW